MDERTIKVKKGDGRISLADFGNHSQELCYFCCLSAADVFVIAHNLANIISWQTRWGEYQSDGLFTVANDSQFAEIKSYLLDFQDRIERTKSEMSCLDNGLIAIAAAISELAKKSGNCCGDGQTVINIGMGPTPGGGSWYGTELPGGNENEGLGSPPEGYDSWDDYYEDKCQKANWATDVLISNIKTLSIYTMVQLIGAGFIVGLIGAGVLVAVPPLLAPMLVVAIGALGLGYSELQNLAGWMVDHRSDVVCAMYTGKTVSAVVDSIGEIVDEAAAAAVISSSLSPLLKTVVLLVASTDFLNKLFDTALDIRYPDATCSCNDCGIFVAMGTPTEASPTEVDVDAQMIHSGYYGFDIYYVRVYLNYNEGDCGARATSDISILYGQVTTVNDPYDLPYAYWETSDMSLPGDGYSSPQSGLYRRVVQIQSRTSFSARITITGLED